MGTILGREPAAIATFLALVLDLAITFGLNLTPEQLVLVNAVIVAGLGLIVRQAVYSPAKTQEIANNSTYLEAGSKVDIGNPPSGPTGPGGAG